MTIQLNTDKNLTIHQEYEEKIKNEINKGLAKFDDLITRMEVHLSDENGSKEGIDDKRCLLEARISGREPIAVSSLGNSYDLALHGAITKLKNKLETIAGKLKTH
ncbi:HPF/RaiA family ribosome-associated protein [Pedobacter sp. PLR]|uniref:HPF/RaiA family ribosome-associated protein n=1 Tax=Pedobacter sp. PLR TaxID=2994465 RepID=UPI0022477FDF|nr:HPF/RaiA family ribosome-associated protein [Pedobacter sp. PLR]MCX2453852.1 HPF/RaiA family ribosome-associated protein [Pedobacter sp. PLR]